MAESLSIGFSADFSEYRKKLEQMPGITEKGADKLTKAWIKQYNKQQKIQQRALNLRVRSDRNANDAIVRDRERAAREIAAATQRATDNIKGSAERTASLLGGTFADVSDVALDLGERILSITTNTGGWTGVAVGAAAGAGAFALGLGFIATSAMEFVNSSDQMIERLREIDSSTGISPSTQAALDNYTLATTQLEAASLKAKIEIAGGLAPVLTEAADATRFVVEATQGATGWWFEARDSAREAAGGATAWLDALNKYASPVLGLQLIGDAMGYAAEQGRELEEIVHDGFDFDPYEVLNADAIEKSTKAKEAAKKADEARTRAVKAATSAAREHWQELERQADAEMAYAAKVAASKQAYKDMEAADASRFVQTQIAARVQMKETQKAAAELQKQMGATFAPDIIDDWSETFRQQIANATDQIGGLGIQLTQLAVDGAQHRQSVLEEEAEAILERTEKQASKAATRDTEKVARLRANGKLSDEEATRELANIETRRRASMQAARDEVKVRRNLAIKSFKAEKKMSVGIAAANAAVAATKVIAMYGPPPSPGAIQGLLGTAATLATSLAAIRRQKPPSFPMGRNPDPDHPITARIQPDEAILNRRAVRALGGSSSVAALNQGGGTGGTSIGTVIIQLDARETRQLMSGGPVEISGFSDPHKGGRRAR